ncbi:MAG: hypothetical protein ACRDQU_08960 [Pseudonocardiaceae bacterium]
MEAPAAYGLNTTPKELRKVILLRHPQEDSDSWRERAPWLRDEVERLLGEDIPAVGPHGGKRTPTQVRGTNLLPRSDTSGYIAARLKRDDPELATRVVNGKITPNAAARAKGWRKPRIVVSNPKSVAYRKSPKARRASVKCPPARRHRR